MILNKKFILFITISLISNFMIVSKERYPALPASGQATKEGISVVVDALSPEQCVHCFGVEGRKNLVPLRFRITNNGSLPVTLSYDGVGLPLMHPSDAAQALSRSNFLSFLFRGAGFCFGLGMVASGAVAIVSIIALAPVTLGTSLFSMGFFAVPTVGFSLGADYFDKQSNVDVTSCIDCKVLEKDWDLPIGPGQRIQTFVFMRSKKYQPHFVVNLYDKKNNKNIDFPIDLEIKQGASSYNF